MKIYKLVVDPRSNTICAIEIVGQNTSFPFDPANTDYQKFKKDVLAGAELQDADGNVMTAEESTTYISTLP